MGTYKVEGCPKYDLTSEIWDMVKASLDADAGHLPVSGGTLDQTKSFIDGWRFVRNECERWRVELKLG